MISRRTLTQVRGAHILSRTLSSRASAVLGALDIPTATVVPGVYDGAWSGSGEVFESVCPTTGEVLAGVQGVSDLAITSRGARSDYAWVLGVAAGAADCHREVSGSIPLLPVCARSSEG